MEDSGCVCLFYYHRLIIAREVRGLTSISPNCCESLWASTEARNITLNISCIEAEALRCRTIYQILSKFPHLHFHANFPPFSRWPLKGLLKCRDIK